MTPCIYSGAAAGGGDSRLAAAMAHLLMLSKSDFFNLFIALSLPSSADIRRPDCDQHLLHHVLDLLIEIQKFYNKNHSPNQKWNVY